MKRMYNQPQVSVAQIAMTVSLLAGSGSATPKTITNGGTISDSGGETVAW